MRVLVGFEFSGIVREAFAERGHVAMSCDLLPSELPGAHYQGDVRIVMHTLIGYNPDGSKRWSENTPAEPLQAANWHRGSMVSGAHGPVEHAREVNVQKQRLKRAKKAAEG